MAKKIKSSSKKSTITQISEHQHEVEQKVEQVAEQVATEIVEEVVEATEEVAMSDEQCHGERFAALLESMKVFTKTVRDTMTGFQSELRTLMAQSKKLCKRTRKRTRGNKSPNGFTKTVKVSPEMVQFCGKDASTTEMSRNEVNQFLHSYIRTNNLQNPNNKRQIVPDATLKKILDLNKLRTKKELQEAVRQKGATNQWTEEQLASELAKVTEKEQVNYFNLQRLVNHHYV